MLSLFTALVGEDVAARRWPIFFSPCSWPFTSALLRWCSYRLLGLDYPWYFQVGVAAQYALGPFFQPSALGAFLVVAVALFARDRPILAVGAIGLAATVHSTYLLVGGLLTAGFLAALLAEGRARQALAVGALALALVLPVTVYVLVTFGPTTSERFAEAQAVLVDVRIPHHARPDRWFDTIASLQIAWMVLGIALVRTTRLFLVLLVPFVLGVSLTLVQLATGSPTLALLFPWRVSVVLVPIATTIVLSRVAALRISWLDGAAARTVSALVVVALLVAGAWIGVERLAFYSNDDELAVLDFVRDNKAPGDVYFLPVSRPGVGARGSLSSDFKPPPDKRQDHRLISVDLQRFRLYTGAAIFVDFKSIPYKDTEVLEWWERFQAAQHIQELLREGRTAPARAQLRDRGVTHVIWRTQAGELSGADFRQVYEDENYRVYRLRP